MPRARSSFCSSAAPTVSLAIPSRTCVIPAPPTAHAAESLCALADAHADGRLLAMGGGGYNRRNLALACSAVDAAVAITAKLIDFCLSPFGVRGGSE